MTGEDYVPRPNGRFVSFADQPGGPPPAPYTWPQDTLTVPTGFGALPLVDNLNANLARREFYGISAQWPQAAIGSVNVVNIPLPKDGDFWLDNIGTVTIFPAHGAILPAPQNGVVSYLQIEDANNGYPLMSSFVDDYGAFINGAPWGAFNAKEIVLLSTPAIQSLGIPFGAGTRTNMIQPYCFLRGGAIRITLTVPPQAFPFPTIFPGQLYDWYINLAGWKEYAYAAD
jgi:hypothetical protein